MSGAEAAREREAAERREKEEQKRIARQVQYGLFAVAAVSVVCAILHAWYPKSFDQATAMFLAIAIVALVIHQISKFKGFGVEFELFKQLKEEVKDVEAAVNKLEKNVGPGRKEQAGPGPSPSGPPSSGPPQSGPPPSGPPPSPAAAGAVPRPPVDPSDPNKGQFGGMAVANGRELTAKISPAAGPKSSACRVVIKVASTDPQKPLTGQVQLYLHPTFGQWSAYPLEVRGGIATDEIVSYGAFTIGAEADDGKTRLELDLMDVTGGTTRFYEE